MPPQLNSRHTHTTAQLDAAREKLFLSDRIPFRYGRYEDNATHVVKGGETLQMIASRFFAPLGRLPKYSAANLWWIIADFQPTPIHDPTLRLAEGQVLIIPSVATVIGRVLAPPDARVG